jgi:hypothetical protein
MDTDLLKTVGQIAGIGGLAIGMIVLLFRRIIGKLASSKLSSKQAYRLFIVIVVCSWSVALLGIGAWAFVEVSLRVSGQPEDNHDSGGNGRRWRKTEMLLKDLKAYEHAREQGPPFFVNKHGFLTRLRSLDFPNTPDVVQARDLAIRVIGDTPTTDTGIQTDMKITSEIMDALDELFYAIRLEAHDCGQADWPH